MNFIVKSILLIFKENIAKNFKTVLAPPVAMEDNPFRKLTPP